MFFKTNQFTSATAATLKKSAVCLSLIALSQVASANPDGAAVVAGTVKTDIKGNTLAVRASDGTIIDWKSFGIDAGEATVITLDSNSGRILNRVVGGSRSDINGALSSNGTVFLINTNGVAVGNGAVIDTNGLVLSGLNLSNADFASGNYRFSDGAGSVSNAGTIGGGKYQGSIALIGSKVSNSGLITTNNGDVVLAAGQKIKLASIDASDVYIEVSAPENEVVNLGTLNASRVIAMLAPTVKNSGTANAATVTIDDDGDVVITDGEPETPDVNDGTSEPNMGGGSVNQGSGDGAGPGDSPTNVDDPDTDVVEAPATGEPGTRPDPTGNPDNSQPGEGPQIGPREGNDEPEIDTIIEQPVLVEAPRLPSFIVDDGVLLASLMQENTLEILRLQESLESGDDILAPSAEKSAKQSNPLKSKKSVPGLCQ